MCASVYKHVYVLCNHILKHVFTRQYGPTYNWETHLLALLKDNFLIQICSHNSQACGPVTDLLVVNLFCDVVREYWGLKRYTMI